MNNRLANLDKKIGPKSPLPYLIQLRNWVFGTQITPRLTRLSFYVLFLLFLLFFFWNVLAFVALTLRETIQEQRQISITDLLSERAVELEVYPPQFIEKLLVVHVTSAFLWLIFAFGLILLWRKVKAFFIVCSVSLVVYLALMFKYVGGFYFWEEFLKTEFWMVYFALLYLCFYYFLIFNRFGAKDRD